MLSSPVRVISSENKLAIPIAILIVVPEFSVLISGTFAPIFIDSFTMIVDFSTSMIAPNFLHASMVAFVSADSRTFSILLLLPASDAKKIPLCV